jgi:hypothetical protein
MNIDWDWLKQRVVRLYNGLLVQDLGMGTGVGETRFVWREKNDFQVRHMMGSCKSLNPLIKSAL